MNKEFDFRSKNKNQIVFQQIKNKKSASFILFCKLLELALQDHNFVRSNSNDYGKRMGSADNVLGVS